MIAFINGMFCQSLQCDLLNIEKKPHTTQKECWGVTTLALLEAECILDKQSVTKTKVDSSHNEKAEAQLFLR
jgi:hypothetical protein